MPVALRDAFRSAVARRGADHRGASINSCNATVRVSRSDVDNEASVPASRAARSDRADSELVIVRCSPEGLVASENHTMTNISPRTGAASYTARWV
jgi:hypothetical protein